MPYEGTCQPRWATRRTPGRPTTGGRAARIAAALGKPFMPWQQYIADVGGEIIPETGLPAYRKIVFTVPRQSGKTTLMLAEEVDRCLLWTPAQPLRWAPKEELWVPTRPELLVPQRQLVIYTAQTGLDARKKFVDEQAPMIDQSPLRAAVQLTARGEVANKAAGHEKITWRTGSRIALQASTDASGHGETVHQGVIDEAFADVDAYREGALVPAQVTVADAQLWVMSTMGTDRSAYLNSLVKAGRASVEAGETAGTAYFEWSAGDDDDPADPATWWGCMPALGHTVTEATVRAIYTDMAARENGLAEFVRAFLNRRSVTEDRDIPAQLWVAVCSETVAPDGKMALGLAVHPDQRWASLVLADELGRCELVEHGEGISWVPDRAVSVATRWGLPIVVDERGPAASLVPEIRTAGATVVEYSLAAMAKAAANVYGAVADGRIQVRRHPVLDDAAKAVRRRPTGDVWVWGRNRSEQDVSAFEALTLAFDAAPNAGITDGDVWLSWD